MADGFKFDLDVRRMLARLQVMRMRWTGDVLQQIGDFAAAQILADSTQSFRKQADPTTGTPWTSSKRAQEAYLAASRAFLAGKRKRSPRRMTTLVDTGRLRSSVRSGYEMSATGTVVAWGGTTPLAYAAIHQFGGRAGRNHAAEIPARPYVGLSPDRVQKIATFARKAMAEAAS
jgi:phage virion morphogenesis protein